MSAPPNRPHAAHRVHMNTARKRATRGLVLATLLVMLSVAAAWLRLPLGLSSGIDPLLVAAMLLFAIGAAAFYRVDRIAHLSGGATDGS